MPSEHHLLQALEKRVGQGHLRQRLGIETDHEARIFGQGLNFFHIENWYSVHSLIRNVLRVFFLHGRGKRNARRIVTRENRVKITNLPPAFDGFTVLHLSDLHLDMAADLSHVLAERVRNLEYDLCVITGDFRARTFGPFDAAIESVAALMPHLKSPVYGVLGNHDTIRMVPALEGLGVRLLLNESTVVELGGERLHLAGIDDAHYYRADNLEKAIEGIPDGEVSILLSHTPELFRHAAHSGFELMLSGHTHGGQICLPGGRPVMCNMRCPRALCAGPWRYQGMQGYTSVGSGVSVVDVRLNCPPEVTLHRLYAA